MDKKRTEKGIEQPTPNPAPDNQRELLETVQRLEAFHNAAFEGIAITREGVFLDVNKRYCEIVGYKRGELIGGEVLEVVAEEDREMVAEKIRTRYCQPYEHRARHKDGSIVFLEVHGQNIHYQGLPARVTAVHDITDRKAAERKLTESEERYRTFVEHLQGIAYKGGIDFKPLFFHGKTEEITGYREEDFIAGSLRWDQIIHPEDKVRLAGSLRKIREVPNFADSRRYRIIRKNGEVRWLHEFIQNSCDETGTPRYVQGLLYDITEQKQAEEALRESEEKYRTVADYTYGWEYWVAPDGNTFLYVSPGCEEITGYTPEELMRNPGLFMQTIVHQDDRHIVLEHKDGNFFNKKLCGMEFRIVTKQGEEKWLEHHCRPVFSSEGEFLGRRGSNRDMTDRKQLERETQKLRNLESLGVLAGGIAHDFNNLLTAIFGNIELARLDLDPACNAAQLLSESEKALERTRNLTSRLLTFSRGGEPLKKIISLAEVVRDVCTDILTGTDVQCDIDMPDGLWPVEVDREQLRHVLHNLLNNAKEAMPDGGRVLVRAENRKVGKATAHLQAGKYVKLSVTDHGGGIDPSIIERVFDPYFSTKEMGTRRGTGMGLAICHSVIKRHGGHIAVESTSRNGTTLVIFLPALDKRFPAEAEKAAAGGLLPSVAGKILLMEDEQAVIQVVSRMLNHLGCSFDIVEKGEDAISMYTKALAAGSPYALVVLDLTIRSGMGGEETMERLYEIDPRITAVVASGYADDIVLANYEAYGFKGALAKPYSVKSLISLIKQYL